MHDQLTLTPADLAALSAKLASLDGLDEDDRHALAGVFVLAARAQDDGADVSGFAALQCTCTYVPRTFTILWNPNCPIHGAKIGRW